MKFTLSWLKDHLETEASLTEITDALTSLGLELEGVDDPAAKLKPFTICYVREAKQHPNADRLRVCMVETEEGGELVQVVCGAPNARTGMKGVFAPSGAYVPGTDMTLKPGVIRGEESNGMLCSEREMGLSDDHDGIIDLPEDAPLGKSFAEYMGLDDPVIEIAITPDRGDCLGVRGIARDLAAKGLGTLKPIDLTPVEGTYDSPLKWARSETIGNDCSYVAGRHFRGVKNGPSPAWVQRRLTAIGLRPISALVDVTNYVTHDLGRPLHVFDAAKVKGDTLLMRHAEAGEKILALDGKEYTLEAGMPIIADENGPEGIGGIMGGELSGCTDETTEVFLECAPVRCGACGRDRPPSGHRIRRPLPVRTRAGPGRCEMGRCRGCQADCGMVRRRDVPCRRCRGNPKQCEDHRAAPGTAEELRRPRREDGRGGGYPRPARFRHDAALRHDHGQQPDLA